MGTEEGRRGASPGEGGAAIPNIKASDGSCRQRSGQTAAALVGRPPEPNRSGRSHIQRCYGNMHIRGEHSALMQQVNNFAGDSMLICPIIRLLPPRRRQLLPQPTCRSCFGGSEHPRTCLHLVLTRGLAVSSHGRGKVCFGS